VPGKYRPENYVSDARAFLQGEVTEPAVLFGASAGGMVALDTAGQCPEMVRAVVVGDSPIDIQALVAWMSTDAFASHFAALRDLAGSGQPVPALARALGDLPAPIQGQEPPVAHRDLPGMDDAHLRAWAKTISQLDPGVLAYHAEGRGKAFMEGFDMERILQQITCPVLLLRASPKLGALMSAEAADWATTVLADGVQVILGQAEHDLGLSTWEVGPLLRAVTGFLESL
jgi:pimeloyl-ACP methyl ester carboxylesterase